MYVNCWEDHTRFQALYAILDELERTVDIHRQSTPRDVLLNRLRDHDESPCVVIFDEVDQLEDKGILYELDNLQQFSLILIVNQEEELLAGSTNDWRAGCGGANAFASALTRRPARRHSLGARKARAGSGCHRGNGTRTHCRRSQW